MNQFKLFSRVLSTLTFLFIVGSLSAQYFGKNKPRYKSFDFKVVETPHFDMYHYLKNDKVVDHVAQMTEQWYDLHQQVVKDTFYHNPIIFYNNHAEFQQTNAISGNIGVGTGGVTEGLKNRVVMPLTYSNQQTFHVLGHELVHAFQFDMIINGDSTSLRNLAMLPLWLVEGMAEYMSIGRIDPFTAMWMRDAVINDDVPTLQKMDSPKYFPYRYGQAAWSFLAGYYGDDVIQPFFYNTAQYGLNLAVEKTLNTNLETLSGQWQSALKTYYQPYIGETKKDNTLGKKLLSDENSGRINVSPSLSPNGRYVVFLSEKDLFSTDLFLADAKTGKILNKVASLVKDGDLDNFNALESAGTWSPNSKKFAFIGIDEGKNVLVIKEALTGKTLEKISIPGLPAFTSPTWSPNGGIVVVSGLVDGQPDLYSYDFKKKNTEQLTDDIYSEIQANFSSNGSMLVFSYDKWSLESGRTNGKYTYDLAIMDMATKSIDIVDVFHGADNLNPSFDHENNIYFLSDRDGYRNLYHYTSETEEVKQMTELYTGISGISKYSPAIAVSRKRDRVLYTHYFDHNYTIYQASTDKLLNKSVDPQDLDFSAGTLPIADLDRLDIVNRNLHDIDNYQMVSVDSLERTKFKNKFKLDYIAGGTGLSVGSSNTFGNYSGLQGGINMIFSDILGNNQMLAQLALNGEILDVGGQFAYINRKNRLAWGASISHIPLRTGYQTIENTTIQDQNGNNFDAVLSTLNIVRVFDEGLNVFTHYPFSTTLRVEGGVGGSFRSFRWDEYKDYYLYDGRGYNLVLQEREKIPTGDEIVLNQYYTLVNGIGANVNAAIVGDNSFFGVTSPLAGHRYRLGVDKYMGTDDYWSVLADARKYFRMKPFTLAVRGTGYLRFEKETNSVYPFFVGNMGFVRGYGSIFSTDIIQDVQLDFGQMLGSKMALTSVELRLPFTGPRGLALIGSNYLFTDLALFYDAGVAFDEFSHFSDGELLNAVIRDEDGNPILDANGQFQYSNQLLKPAIVQSAGLSLRVNLFGAMILEPHVAFPLRKGGRATFGLNFLPGW